MGLHTCSSDYLSICFCLKLAAICATPSNTCFPGDFNTAVVIEFEIFLLGGIFIHPGWLLFKDHVQTKDLITSHVLTVMC